MPLPQIPLKDILEVKQLLRYEVREKAEEGFQLNPEYFEKLIEEAGSIEELTGIYGELNSLNPRNSFGYSEPSDLPGIEKERPSRIEGVEVKPDEKVRLKILGGWAGRCIGCMLGKPVEGWTRDQIRIALTRIGEYPLRKPYIPFEAFAEASEKRRVYVKTLTRGNIKRAERDDDLDYTILNLTVYEKYGSNFTSEDIAEQWLSLLPYRLTYTAERAAYRNLVLGLKPPETAVHLNPYREWIGAQIRADLWGYVSPGNPEQALEYAFRDARISHVKNGIYGELYAAALVSLAFVQTEPETLVEEAVKAVPAKSRLAEALKFTLNLYRKGLEWTEAVEEILSRYGRYHPVHTINNAAILTAALLWGESDFTKTLTYTLLSGLDTDCNCATVGSILGVILTVEAIPKEWITPLNDKVATGLSGLRELRISELADRTFKLVEKRGV